jgi:phage terminase small subunit
MRAKSKELKEMQGTYEPSKETESISIQPYSGVYMPKCPTGWPPRIQGLWNKRCKDLQVKGQLADEFLIGLKQYCFNVMMSDEAQKHLIEEGYVVPETGDKGQVYEVVSKWLTVLEKAQKAINIYEAKFGFSPLDASKIPAVKKDVSNEESLLN